MNELEGAVLIDLLAKTVDINLDEIGFAVEVTVPDMFHNFTAGNEFRRPEKKQLEECKLPGCQWNGLFVARGAPAVTIEREICIAKACVAAVKGPAPPCTDSRGEFRQNKRIGEVIDGARIKPLHSLLDKS